MDAFFAEARDGENPPPRLVSVAELIGWASVDPIERGKVMNRLVIPTPNDWVFEKEMQVHSGGSQCSRARVGVSVGGKSRNRLNLGLSHAPDGRQR